MKGIKHLKIKIICTVAAIAVVAVITIFGGGCLFYKVFGIPCMSCGLTRALVAALRFDFVNAFRYNPLFFTVPVLYLYILKDGKPFKNKILNISVFSVIIVMFALLFVLRIFVPEMREFLVNNPL